MVQTYFTHAYRIFHPINIEVSSFSESHGSFSKSEQVLGYKDSLKNYNSTERISCISLVNRVRIDVSTKRNHRSYTITYRLSQNTLELTIGY